MLTRLIFTNFKSWPEADLECGRITGVFGTNSSGKTSLLQFLLLLKQTKDATDRATTLALNGGLVELGTMRDVIHRHDDSSSITWGIRFDLDHTLALSDSSVAQRTAIVKSQSLALGASVGIQDQAPISRGIAYRLRDMKFSLEPKKNKAAEFDLVAKDLSPAGGSVADFSFKRAKGRAWGLPGPIKSYAFPDQARTYFQNAGFLADLETAYEKQLDRIYYLGPLRDYPRRDYLWARSRPTDVGKKGEQAVDAILAATAAGETRNLRPWAHHRPFQEMIAHWLREMGLIEGFKIEEIAPGSNRWQAKVRTRKGASEVLLTDVGFGVSQVLPVITLLQYVPEGSTVLLEQPEIHLHPLAQAGLADVIIQAATHRKVQVILESHSEHLLLRLQRRIAEEQIASDDVKLYFCDAPRGKSTLTPLEVDMFGNIQNWPDKFMGDAFGETAEAELARLRRMRAQGQP